MWFRQSYLRRPRGFRGRLRHRSLTLSRWKREVEARSFSIRLHPNPTAVSLYNALAYRQADTGSRIILPVQALKNLEDLLRILGRDADPIVPHAQRPFPLPPFG